MTAETFKRLIVLFFWLVASTASGQHLDQSFLPQLEGFNEVHQDESFDKLSIPLQSGHRRDLQGDKVFIQYEYDLDTDANPGVPYIFGRYEEAIKGLSPKQLYREETRGVYAIEIKGTKHIIIIEAYLNAATYSVTLFRPKIKTVADKMYEQLERDGHLALYINFETGKADLSKDSDKQIESIALLLNAKTDLKISIEGHTDDVGNDIANKKLSYRRAKAVMQQLILMGIPAYRLQAKGWGEEKPIATNETDHGRHKNRRVELVRF
jgi:outer membrane protein OmpA-like peptidoglycan-associated protein